MSFPVKDYDLVVLTHTCDLVEGRNKTSLVLFCPVFTRTELTTVETRCTKESYWKNPIVSNDKEGFLWELYI